MNLSQADLKKSVSEYIEVFYNRQPRHSYLDYLSQVEAENKMHLYKIVH